MTSVRIVVVAWNSGTVLPRCLTHLRATQWEGEPLEIIVVDNGSRDGSVDDWPGTHPGIELRQTGRNLGFGAAVNVALRDLEHVDFVALVNPDAFVEPGWLAPLVDALTADPRCGAACPKILFDAPDPQGRSRIQNVGNVIGRTWELHDRGYGEPDLGQYDVSEDVWGWCGGAVLLKRSYLADVGRFDESLFLYAEDVDLSWRGAKRGWTYRYEPSSVVRHVHRASSGQERTPLLDYLNRRNRLVVVTRHAPVAGKAVAWIRAGGGMLAALARDVILPILRRRPADAPGLRRRWVAATDAIRLLGGRDPRHHPDAGRAERPS